MPCGYNQVEKELKTINVNGDRSKVIFGINGCDNIVEVPVETTKVLCYQCTSRSTSGVK